MNRTIVAAIVAIIAISATACGRERRESGPSDYERGQTRTMKQVREAEKLCAEINSLKAKIRTMPLRTKQDVAKRNQEYNNLLATQAILRRNPAHLELESCRSARGGNTDLLPQPPASSSSTAPAPTPPAASSGTKWYYHKTYDSDSKS